MAALYLHASAERAAKTEASTFVVPGGHELFVNVIHEAVRQRHEFHPAVCAVHEKKAPAGSLQTAV